MNGEPLIRWDWLADHIDQILGRAGQHLYLALIAVAIGFVISFALAAISIRRRAIYPIVATAATITYTIPSLAIFAAFVSITGISLETVEIPLVLYTLVIFVPNIVAGFDSVPFDVLDAADGMGFTGAQRWRQVELPLAVPLVVAGLRLASVSTIGLVTVSGTLGDSFGGLGYYILDGYHRSFPTEILVGGLLSILLAVAADVVFVQIQRILMPWTSNRSAGSRATAAGATGGEA